MKRRVLDYVNDIELLTAMQQRSFEINFPGEPFYERVFRDELRRPGAAQVIYLYEERDELLGWLWLDFARQPASVHIRHIQVAERHWGEGLGRTILEDALALACERRCREITLNVTKSNARAMALYEGLGFEMRIDLGERQFMALRLDAADDERDLSD